MRRAYASASPTQSSNNIIWAGLGAAVIGGVVYYFNGSPQTDAKLMLLSRNDSAHGEPTFKGDDKWVDLKLKEIIKYNHNTSRFIFHLPTDEHVSGLHTASAILTKYQGPEDDKPTMRPYTPISDTDRKGEMELLIKRYPNGPMSEKIHSMAPDQRLSMKGPLPKYEWKPNKHEHLAMIAGGTGITPMYQIIRAIFKNPEDKTKVTLVYGNISEDDILLREEFSHLENEFPNRFRGFYVVEKGSDKLSGQKGYITKDLLKTVMPSPSQGNKVHAFVCGPPGLYKAMSGMKPSPREQGDLTGILKELGWQSDQFYKF